MAPPPRDLASAAPAAPPAAGIAAPPRPAAAPAARFAPDERRRLHEAASYWLTLAASVAAGVLAIWLIATFLPHAWAIVLIDIEQVTYPFTVQTVQWIVFALGLGELLVRAREAAAERAQLRAGYLPEDETTLLQGPDLRQIYATARRAREPGGTGHGRFLPRLIHRVVTQFQTMKSVDQANAVLNSSLELYLHEIDLRYTMTRYIIWAIPTLGFLGTVLGIALALDYAGSADMQDPHFLSGLTRELAVAFNTTLVALCMSTVLVLVQHIVQAAEERALNRSGQYCLDNLINRLYVD
jgi:biopolymer transport protein ExbB/TolQ